MHKKRIALLLVLAACPLAAHACFSSPSDPSIDFRVADGRKALEAVPKGGGSAVCVLKLDCAVRPSPSEIRFTYGKNGGNSLQNVAFIRFLFDDKTEQSCSVTSAALGIPPAPKYPDVDPKLKNLEVPKKP
jgi:hypothetical protein